MKYKKGDIIVFKGNSRPRIVTQITTVHDKWDFVLGEYFHWGNMNFVGSGNVEISSIIEMASQGEVEEYKQLKQLYGERGPLYETYEWIKHLSSDLKKAHEINESLSDRLKHSQWEDVEFWKGILLHAHCKHTSCNKCECDEVCEQRGRPLPTAKPKDNPTSDSTEEKEIMEE